MRVKYRISLLVLSFGLVPLLWLGYQLKYFWGEPLIPQSGVARTFVFYPGSTIKQVANYLQREGLLRNRYLFISYVKLVGAECKMQAGEYLINPGITARQLVVKMARGELLNHAFTLVEGWNFTQLIASLQHNPYLKHTITGLSPEAIMERLGHAGEHPEGRFAPDTYLFSGTVSDLDILLKAYNLMKNRLAALWLQRSPMLSAYHCPYQALIVASLIEKETANQAEKPIIAGVILRRLKLGWLLQVDPTVVYGLGEHYTGKLRKQDLKKETAYNTYRRRGLPPTPICMPSQTSIAAALQPVETPYLYYVSKGDGSHEFSISLKQQNQAIRRIFKKNK